MLSLIESSWEVAIHCRLRAKGARNMAFIDCTQAQLPAGRFLTVPTGACRPEHHNAGWYPQLTAISVNSRSSNGLWMAMSTSFTTKIHIFTWLMIRYIYFGLFYSVPASIDGSSASTHSWDGQCVHSYLLNIKVIARRSIFLNFRDVCNTEMIQDNFCIFYY